MTKLIILICLTILISPVSASEVLKIAYGDGYAPFAWMGERQAKGVQIDFLDEILVQRLGFEVHHVACPWKRCQRLVENAELDGFFTVPTDSRAEYTEKTKSPFYTTNFLIHTKKDHPLLCEFQSIRSLEELLQMQGLRHVFMRGSGWHEQNLAGLKNITQVADAAVIPKLLVQNRADLYLEQAEMFKYQASQLGLQDQLVSLSSPVIKRQGWHLFIGKSSLHVGIVAQVDSLLEDMQSTGELEQLRRIIFARYGILTVPKA
ncbi:transporter substrate-binding domain-containing protein [Alteromonas sp. ASW11-36]|uniref:Transporter substrate-binding domain-containing protein n=1 Tax=Alteromonas arenosi TaxID=3055817 RepID=A0ABT7SUD5_9ALTE|nr:transporter substrate-binding domain-containing protein [Alteromonas sp. ASW11-36]MDM7859810.1 transporter substrate-binding domain-containing protein [Alteromonas sp. ASW11-36]